MMLQSTAIMVNGIYIFCFIGRANGYTNHYAHRFEDLSVKKAQERNQVDSYIYFSEVLRDEKTNPFEPGIEVMDWFWPTRGANERIPASASSSTASNGISTTGPVRSPGGRRPAEKMSMPLRGRW